MRPNHTSSETSPELASAVGQIIAQLLEGLDVDLLEELQLHVLVQDRPMKAWLKKLGLPELREEDCFWGGTILPLITQELERRAEEPN